MDLLYTLLAFLVALAILIAVHEFGHFWAARRLGVLVLRFSIGFGRPLISWRSRRGRHAGETEFAIAAIPLGGYVKMLDEREEDPVPPEQAHRAFNRQPIWKRAAIILAGPVFNFLLAILIYWALFIAGETTLRAVVGEVSERTPAAVAGFRPGDEILRVGPREVTGWEGAIFALIAESFEGVDVAVQVRDADGALRERWLTAADLDALSEERELLTRLGLSVRRPPLPAVIGELVPGEAAEQAGLRVGDRILTAEGASIASWQEWVTLVRERPGEPLRLEVQQGDEDAVRLLTLVPSALDVDGTTIGRIGAGVAVPPDFGAEDRVRIRYGPVESLDRAIDKTLDMSLLMLRVIGRMLTGQASVDNLSGPITIAETAGRTASYGLDSFLKFLAVVSISLGVLNLLPIPVLDGGHLLFLGLEALKGRPLSEEFLLRGQQLGLLMIAALMTLAFYVDLSRLLG